MGNSWPKRSAVVPQQVVAAGHPHRHPTRAAAAPSRAVCAPHKQLSTASVSRGLQKPTVVVVTTLQVPPHLPLSPGREPSHRMRRSSLSHTVASPPPPHDANTRSKRSVSDCSSAEYQAHAATDAARVKARRFSAFARAVRVWKRATAALYPTRTPFPAVTSVSSISIAGSPQMARTRQGAAAAATTTPPAQPALAVASAPASPAAAAASASAAGCGSPGGTTWIHETRWNTNLRRNRLEYLPSNSLCSDGSMRTTHSDSTHNSSQRTTATDSSSGHLSRLTIHESGQVRTEEDALAERQAQLAGYFSPVLRLLQTDEAVFATPLVVEQSHLGRGRIMAELAR